ncbi:MAG TPA: electron transport complex subunit RsxG [Gammaproteobacteria bacterium]|nr:electron transport complex subunit RsxG [Gammaproteobacteria bacterium]
MNVRQIGITAAILLLFAVIGTAMVAATYEGTRERITANERETLLRKLSQLIPPDAYDNNLLDDSIELPAGELADRPLRVYRARRQGQPVAVVMNAIAPDGYSGSIYLLVGVRHDGSVAGVRVVTHRETPGLGDGIDEERSDWIHGFAGRSLDDPLPAQWAVRKDGGVFDQFTGATISPRAVVKAVHAALLYYRAHRDALFATPAVPEQP